MDTNTNSVVMEWTTPDPTHGIITHNRVCSSLTIYKVLATTSFEVFAVTDYII